MNHFLGYRNVDRLGSIEVGADVEFTQADDGPAETKPFNRIPQ